MPTDTNQILLLIHVLFVFSPEFTIYRSSLQVVFYKKGVLNPVKIFLVNFAKPLGTLFLQNIYDCLHCCKFNIIKA